MKAQKKQVGAQIIVETDSCGGKSEGLSSLELQGPVNTLL